MRKRRMGKPTQFLLGFLILIVTLFVAVGIFMTQASSPFAKAKKTAVALAKENTDLKTPESFDIVTTDETVYSLIGQSKSGTKIGVLIPKSSKTIKTVNLSDGVTAESVASSTASSTDLALYKDKPVWQVNEDKGFKVYDFKTGKLIYKIG